MSNRKPYLLSTTATLRRFKILDYDGYDFTLKPGRRRSYTAKAVPKLVLENLYGIIIPNAIVAKRSGKYVEWKDIMVALQYSMTHGKAKGSTEAWQEFFKTRKEDWFPDHVRRPVHFFALDIPWNGKKKQFSTERLPGCRRWTIERFVREKMDVSKLKPYGNRKTPALNELISAYAADRSVAEYTTAEFKERFRCSNRTITKFKAYLKERETRGMYSSSLVLPRPQRRMKDAGKDRAEARTA